MSSFIHSRLIVVTRAKRTKGEEEKNKDMIAQTRGHRHKAWASARPFIQSTFCCCAAGTCDTLPAAQPAHSAKRACGSASKIVSPHCSRSALHSKDVRTLYSMLNSPLPCVAPRSWLEYPNMSFNATSATAVNSSSRTSLSMIVPRRAFKPPITAPLSRATHKIYVSACWMKRK